MTLFYSEMKSHPTTSMTLHTLRELVGPHNILTYAELQ